MALRFRFLPAAAVTVWLVFFPLFAACRKDEPAGPAETAEAAEVAPGKVADPVCGMEVDPATAPAKATYAGKTYYFCSKEEKEQFEKEPEKYVKKES